MESRIRRNIYILLGVTVFLLLAMIAGWFFALVRPQKEQITKIESEYTARKAVADRLKTALSDLKKTEDRQLYLKGQLAFFRQRYRSLYFGDIGTGDASDTLAQKTARLVAWRRWLNEYYSEYGTELPRILNEMADASSVRITQSVKVDAPPKAPEEVVAPANGLFKPVGGGGIGVTVTGQLPDVMDFFNSVNRSPILMVVSTIKLGASAAAAAPAAQNGAAPGAPNAATTADPTGAPDVQVSFTITPYLLASGPGVPLGGDAPAGAAATGAGAAGTPGSTPGAPPDSASTSNTASTSNAATR